MAKQDDYTRYTMRIPTPLYERVKAAAGEKSVNAEIVSVLEREYPEPRAVSRELIPYIEAAIAGMKSAQTEEDLIENDRKLQAVLFALLGGSPFEELFTDEEIEPFLVTEYDQHLRHRYKAELRNNRRAQGLDPDAGEPEEQSPTPRTMRPDAPKDAPKPRSMRKP